MSKNKKLTVEQLKLLKWRMTVHMNGGNEYSAMTRESNRYGLLLTSKTTGSPEYKYTSRVITTADGELVADLLAEDVPAELERFVEAYNRREEDTK